MQLDTDQTHSVGILAEEVIDEELDGEDLIAFAHSVSDGLSAIPKRMESRYLYDARGSVLFEQICEQPEYYLTRTEADMLKLHADEIARVTGMLSLVELGAGTAIKTHTLLASYCALYERAHYVPVDISRSSLLKAEQQITESFPQVVCSPLNTTYEQGLGLIDRHSPVMLLFLGSTMGNLDESELRDLWCDWADQLQSGDFLLLGVDINTDVEALDAAYNDRAGVTADFTLNLFARMNRELGSHLDIAKIDHVAKYNSNLKRVEIWAKFRESQIIEIPMLGLAHKVIAGELIQTEISRRFTIENLESRGSLYGFKTEQVFCDDKQRFALLLMRRL